MNRRILKEVVIQQGLLKSPENLVERAKFKEFSLLPVVSILSGIRRCGKSTLLSQIRSENRESDYYLNFDDERLLHFKADDFQVLHELFIELYGIQKTFYFDEIQNIKDWEFFIRRMHDEGFKIYITGSNARLLSKELGTHLTGRHIQVELYPFSFKEFLVYRKVSYQNRDLFITQEKAKLISLFLEYQNSGGFPEYLKFGNEEYLRSLYSSILYRDLLVRNKIINEVEVKELGHFISSNIAKPMTYNSLKKIINVKHVNTVKSYLKYFEDTYLVFLLSKYDYSLKKQLHNPKKMYFIDNALARSISFRFSEDYGRFLENTVFLELKRQGKELYYHREKHECDFLIREKGRIIEAIQVTVSLDDENTKKRELRGVLEALECYQLDEGLILTESEDFIIESENKIVKVVPIWKWLLM